MHVKDLPPIFHRTCPSIAVRSLVEEAVSTSQEAQYLLFTSIANLDSPVIESLKLKLQIPIYSIGSAIPYFDYTSQSCSLDYLTWLDAQPTGSVLYISQGSFLSLSDEQLDEIIAGIHGSGIQFFWVARKSVERLEESGGDNRGLVVPWCDQLRVLCHPSIGGFWSHCGWNSVKEGVFAGVPFLTFPIAFDQFTNSKQIVEDWKVGWRVKKVVDGIVTREEIAQLVRRFMDPECVESNELRRKAKQIGEICRQSIEGGSDKHDLENFIEDVSRC